MLSAYYLNIIYAIYIIKLKGKEYLTLVRIIYIKKVREFSDLELVLFQYSGFINRLTGYIILPETFLILLDLQPSYRLLFRHHP